MPAQNKLQSLIIRFEENREAYLSGRYNETQLRREFVDPLFKELGWDVDNEGGLSEAYKDVIHEDAIKIGGASKAPDYCFRVGGTRKFFVEAKKPSVNLKDDSSPAFQLRRYAWSAKLPLSILTDFEEFVVYDCRVKPLKSDKPTTARILYFTYKDLLSRWDEIAGIFSREAVLKGAFDRFAQSAKTKKGTEEVDRAFLDEIESWRAILAKNIASRNSALSARELNFVVQRTIDRIIFLRICEDRGIETYGTLQALINGGNVYQRLFEIFERADDRYNSGIFHFRMEKGRPETPDELSPKIKIDDEVLKGIFKKIYYPESSYEFSVLPVEILGQVYEQFLGQVIHLTEGGRAKIEEKPEVKKAGGVYYTPAYIVDYIVKNTVGKLLEGKTPKQVSKLKVLDPACGSGSFLIGAYSYLLNWHRDWYVKDGVEKWTKGKQPALYQHSKDDWRLTTFEKKKILLNNVYGVDIDSQAVEVTKLSLLLKVLEGESGEVISKQYRLFHERVLPDLGDNIKCGNSLIASDIYNSGQGELWNDEERLRVNAFDWDKEFSEIMGAGGFDAVIGNPPYIPIEFMSEVEKEYYQVKYSQLERKFDSAPVFILAMLQKLKDQGSLGFISSVTWQTGENYSKLREYLFTKAGIERLINLPFDVFENAYVDTGIYILTAKPKIAYEIFRFPKKEKITHFDQIEFVRVPRELVSGPDFKVILDPKAYEILRRIAGNGKFKQLGDFTISTQGLAGNRFQCRSTAKGEEWYPFLGKGQAHRFSLDMEEIVYVDMSDKPSLKRFYEANPKLLIRRVISRQDRLLTAYTDQKMVFKKDINPFIVIEDNWNVYFLLSILNSRLISFLYVNTSSIASKDDFRQTTLAELRRLPIPTFCKGKPEHDHLIELAKAMLKLQKQIVLIRTDHEKAVLQRQIDATDAEIDRLVYQLYGLTEEEIKIVEGSMKKDNP